MTIAEMMFKNKIGCNINLEDELSFTKQLFSETGGYIIEIEKKYLGELQTGKTIFIESFKNNKR